MYANVRRFSRELMSVLPDRNKCANLTSPTESDEVYDAEADEADPGAPDRSSDEDDSEPPLEPEPEVAEEDHEAVPDAEVEAEPSDDHGAELMELAARALEQGIARKVVSPADVLRHATPEVLSRLPAEVMSRVLRAALDTGRLTAEVILEAAPPSVLARYLPPSVLWDIVAEAVANAPEDERHDAFLSDVLNHAIALGLADDPRPSADEIAEQPSVLTHDDMAALLRAGLSSPTFDDALVMRTVGVRVVPRAQMRSSIQEAGARALGHYSFEALCIPLRTELTIFARKLARDVDRAADVIQDSYAKAYKAWPRWRPIGDPSAAARSWMFRIVSNTYTKHYHHAKVRSRAVRERFHDVVEGAHGIDQSDIDSSRTELGSEPQRHFTACSPAAAVDSPFGDEVAAAIRDLVPDHRAVVELFYVKGMGCEEIGRVLRVPKNTVFTRLARARAALGPVLSTFAKKEYGYDGEERRDR